MSKDHDKRKKVKIHADGSCRRNGKGGWASILVHGHHSEILLGDQEDTTNNRAELTSVIRPLEELQEPCEVEISNDSQYVVNGINRYIRNWRRNGWQTKTKQPVKNQDLWKKLDHLLNTHKVKANWVKGHNGDPGNECVDWFAQNAPKLCKKTENEKQEI